MNPLIEFVSGWSETWLQLVVAVLWQFTALAAVAALVAFSLRRSTPALRYWLWQIVAIKLLLMPFWIVWVPLPSFFRAQQNAVALQAKAASPRDGFGETSSSPAPSPSYMPAVSADPEPLARQSWLAQMTWASWLLLAWLIIVVWQIVRVLHQRLRLGRLLRQATPVNDSRLHVQLATLSQQLGLRCVPAALVTDRECSPFVVGLWRPVLVLPQGLLETLNSIQLRQVLLHELGHVKRRDLAWGWLPEIARLLYWFHPVMHWVYYRIRLERELACDQLAMALSGQSAARYADTLVQVVSHASQPALFQTAAASSAGLASMAAQRQHDCVFDCAARQTAPTGRGA